MINYYGVTKLERIFKMKNINLQEFFLNTARKDKIPVTIFLTNGFQFRGIVRGFDNYVIILSNEGKQHVVYKHAISTIVPLKSISMLENMDQEG